MTRRTKRRTAQSKRARAGSFTLVDYQVATSGAIVYPPGVEIGYVLMSFSGVPFVFVLLRYRLSSFIEAAAVRSIVLLYAGPPIATLCSSFFFLVYLDMLLFPSICFGTIAIFSLYGEYVVRFPLLDGVFLPCDHGAGFLTPACVRNHPINQFVSDGSD